MSAWAKDSVIYHFFPMGTLGAEKRNDFQSEIQHRLSTFKDWIPHLKDIGVNTVFFGPILESESHGYDVKDHFHIDRRLGSNDDFKDLVRAFHEAGMKVIMDAVFNHTGRNFHAFQDVIKNGSQSSYCSWFKNLRFEGQSPCGDPFQYESWAGHYNFVKLNLNHRPVRDHLLTAVDFWIREWDLDGLRLDAADVLDKGFLEELRGFTDSRKADFWMVGEVVHGNYTDWVSPTRLQSATNYEAFKGLWSSHNDVNFHEIAHSLQRCFGKGGIYEGLMLYNFADNHDVERVATTLKDPLHLYSLYALMMTMPGIPSLYYGSEFGWAGKKEKINDDSLRPAISLDDLVSRGPQRDLPKAIKRLTLLRQRFPALRHGNYQQIHVDGPGVVFMREFEGQRVLVMINSGPGRVIKLKGQGIEGQWNEVLNGPQTISIPAGGSEVELFPNWGRVFVQSSL